MAWDIALLFWGQELDSIILAIPLAVETTQSQTVQSHWPCYPIPDRLHFTGLLCLTKGVRGSPTGAHTPSLAMAHGRYFDDPHWHPPHWTPEQILFHECRLPALVGLLVALLALAAWVATRGANRGANKGKWRRSTLRLNLALHIACLYLIISFGPDLTWRHDRDVNLVLAMVLRLVLLTYFIGLGSYLHSELGRIDRMDHIQVEIPLTLPGTPAPPSPHGEFIDEEARSLNRLYFSVN